MILSHSTKSNDLRYKNLENLVFKSQNFTYNLSDALYKATKVTDPKELQDITKISLKKCENSAMILEKMNHE